MDTSSTMSRAGHVDRCIRRFPSQRIRGTSMLIRISAHEEKTRRVSSRADVGSGSAGNQIRRGRSLGGKGSALWKALEEEWGRWPSWPRSMFLDASSSTTGVLAVVDSSTWFCDQESDRANPISHGSESQSVSCSQPMADPQSHGWSSQPPVQSAGRRSSVHARVRIRVNRAIGPRSGEDRSDVILPATVASSGRGASSRWISYWTRGSAAFAGPEVRGRASDPLSDGWRFRVE